MTSPNCDAPNPVRQGGRGYYNQNGLSKFVAVFAKLDLHKKKVFEVDLIQHFEGFLIQRFDRQVEVRLLRLQ